MDSSTQRAVGGTGTSFNWLGARSSFLQAAPHLRLIAAGGLAPENVKQAIQILRPWGVDVVSGVESAPGKKDPARVLAFIRSAQQAAAEILQSRSGKVLPVFMTLRMNDLPHWREEENREHSHQHRSPAVLAPTGAATFRKP